LPIADTEFDKDICQIGTIHDLNEIVATD